MPRGVQLLSASPVLESSVVLRSFPLLSSQPYRSSNSGRRLADSLLTAKAPSIERYFFWKIYVPNYPGRGSALRRHWRGTRGLPGSLSRPFPLLPKKKGAPLKTTKTPAALPARCTSNSRLIPAHLHPTPSTANVPSSPVFFSVAPLLFRPEKSSNPRCRASQITLQARRRPPSVKMNPLQKNKIDVSVRSHLPRPPSYPTPHLDDEARQCITAHTIDRSVLYLVRDSSC